MQRQIREDRPSCGVRELCQLGGALMHLHMYYTAKFLRSQASRYALCLPQRAPRVDWRARGTSDGAGRTRRLPSGVARTVLTPSSRNPPLSICPSVCLSVCISPSTETRFQDWPSSRESDAAQWHLPSQQPREKPVGLLASGSHVRSSFLTDAAVTSVTSVTSRLWSPPPGSSPSLALYFIHVMVPCPTFLTSF